MQNQGFGPFFHPYYSRSNIQNQMKYTSENNATTTKTIKNQWRRKTRPKTTAIYAQLCYTNPNKSQDKLSTYVKHTFFS